MNRDELDGALRIHADRLLDALRREHQPFPEMFGSPLPSAREIDAALREQYGAPPPPAPRAYRGGGRW